MMVVLVWIENRNLHFWVSQYIQHHYKERYSLILLWDKCKSLQRILRINKWMFKARIRKRFHFMKANLNIIEWNWISKFLSLSKEENNFKNTVSTKISNWLQSSITWTSPKAQFSIKWGHNGKITSLTSYFQ